MIDRDILISRVIDGEATAEDWSALHAIARTDPSIWSDLASAQQDQEELTAAVRLLSEPAERIEAPILEHAANGLSIRVRALAAWGGWLSAAALALAWVVGGLGPQASLPLGNQAGLIPISDAKQRVLPGLSPDEALETYVANGAREGRVVAIDPDLQVLSAAPLDGQGVYEVVYVRRIVERARLDLYRISQDELGGFVRVPVPELPSPSKPF